MNRRRSNDEIGRKFGRITGNNRGNDNRIRNEIRSNIRGRNKLDCVPVKDDRTMNNWGWVGKGKKEFVNPIKESTQ